LHRAILKVALDAGAAANVVTGVVQPKLLPIVAKHDLILFVTALKTQSVGAY
jgi:hypothetical protein